MLFQTEFLATWPGSFFYHIIIWLAIEAGLGLAWDTYRRTNNRKAQELRLCFALLLAGRMLLVVLSAVNRRLRFITLTHTSLVLQDLLAFSATLLIIWGFGLTVLATSSRQWRRYFLPAQAIAGGVTAIIFLFWRLLALPQASFAWQGRGWQLWQALLYGLAIALLIKKRRARIATGTLITVIPFLLGHLLHLSYAGSLIGVGWERLSNLIGYPLLVMITYRHLTDSLTAGYESERQSYRSDLHSFQQDLQAISAGALHQREEMLFLLETSRIVNASLELPAVLQRTAQHIALGVHADAVIIALRQVDNPSTLRIVTGYDPLSREVWEASQIQLSIQNYPLLAKALQRRAPLLVQNTDPSAELLALHAALGSPNIGPLLIQPLIHRGEGLGLLMLGNARRQRSFTKGDSRLCQSFANQVSGAIANARLYEKVTALLKERQAQASRRQAILDSITEGVIVANSAHEVLMVNPAGLEILAQPEEKMLHRPLAEVCPPIAKTDQATFDLKARIIEGYHVPVYLPNNELLGSVAVLRDVTKEREAERAKSRFIETVSHELRTPITAIKGYADLLFKGAVPAGSDHQKRFVGTIKNNTDRLSVIVNNMIAISEMDKTQSLNLQTVNLESIIENILATLQPALEERNLTLTTEIDPGLPPLTADPLRLRHVFDNLLSNAIKFTQPGGEIAVSIRLISSEESTERGSLLISIADTGVGIPDSEQTRIFEKFYRADNPLQIEAGGPGVGLTIAQNIVERHGGQIWADSTVAQGSKFNVALPLNCSAQTNGQRPHNTTNCGSE